MNRKTKGGRRANPGRRGRWAGTRPGTELSRATPCSLCAGSWMCLIGPTYPDLPQPHPHYPRSAALVCVCLHRKPVSPWTWPPSPRDWSSGGRHPAHRPWSWGLWASRGASDPGTSREKCPTAPSAPPSVSPAQTITEHGRLFISRCMNPRFQEEKTHFTMRTPAESQVFFSQSTFTSCLTSVQCGHQHLQHRQQSLI